jgi:hypothetical protein
MSHYFLAQNHPFMAKFCSDIVTVWNRFRTLGYVRHVTKLWRTGGIMDDWTVAMYLRIRELRKIKEQEIWKKEQAKNETIAVGTLELWREWRPYDEVQNLKPWQQWELSTHRKLRNEAYRHQSVWFKVHSKKAVFKGYPWGIKPTNIEVVTGI